MLTDRHKIFSLEDLTAKIYQSTKLSAAGI
jgi:hypothetical protein